MPRQLIIMTLILVACSLAGRAQDKSTESADVSLIGGRLHFVPPAADAWERAENVTGDNAAAYARRDHQGAIAIEVLPPDAEMSPEFGPAVIRSLRDAHKKAGQKIVYGPKVEPDSRFVLKVHEKYQAGDKVADELHIYRNVGPRVVMVTVNAWVSDDAAAKLIHKAGEDLAASVKWSPAGKK